MPAGGIALDGSRWISCRPNFFLPVEVLSRIFRGKLLDFLAEALAAGKLRFPGPLTALAAPTRFDANPPHPAPSAGAGGPPRQHTSGTSGFLTESEEKTLRAVIRLNAVALAAFRHGGRARLRHLPKKWVVYAKPPFGGPEQVLKYLARYTHRVAISNGRLISLTEDRVSFRWRDSKDGKQLKVMSLEAVEFIRRFLLHILPPGFVKIRHFGFLANRNRAAALTLCREHLKAAIPTLPAAVAFTEEQQRAMERRCPVCQKGTLRIVAWLSAADLIVYRGSSTVACLMASS